MLTLARHIRTPCKHLQLLFSCSISQWGNYNFLVGEENLNQTDNRYIMQRHSSFLSTYIDNYLPLRSNWRHNRIDLCEIIVDECLWWIVCNYTSITNRTTKHGPILYNRSYWSNQLKDDIWPKIGQKWLWKNVLGELSG